MNYLRELRRYKRLTQKAASELIGISLRSYLMYENDPSRLSTRKYREYVNIIDEYVPTGEDRKLTLRRIKAICREMLSGYYIKKCMLVGKYELSELVLQDTLSFIIIIPPDSDFSGELAAQKLGSRMHANVEITCIAEKGTKRKINLGVDAATTVYTAKPIKNVHTATKKSLQ